MSDSGEDDVFDAAKLDRVLSKVIAPIPPASAVEEAQRWKGAHDDIRQFHDACIKELYRMLGVDGSDGEYRFKWAALELSKLLERAEELQRRLRESNIVEIGAGNQSVLEYMTHWEGRAIAAEAALKRADELLQWIIEQLDSGAPSDLKTQVIERIERHLESRLTKGQKPDILLGSPNEK